jgi:hypothetical protein
MASSVSTKTRVTGEVKQVDSVKSLLQTDNIFLYIPNIIGEMMKETF